MIINAKKLLLQSKEYRQKHMNLNQSCIERGGNSTNHRGVLAQYLNTTIPTGRVILAHACGNKKCSNPKHLYWATDYENIIEDGKKLGTYTNPWQRSVAKYGLEKARELNARGDKSAGGKVNKGKSKPKEHRRKISEGVKRSYINRNINLNEVK